MSETGLGFGILGIIEGVQLPNQLLNSHDRGPVTAPDGVKDGLRLGTLGRKILVRKPTRAPMPEPARLAAPPDSSLHEVPSLSQPWGTLAALCATPGAERPPADLTERAAGEQLAAWFTGRWGARTPATFNRGTVLRVRQQGPTSMRQTCVGSQLQ